MKVFLFMCCLIQAAFAFGQRHSISINYKPSLTYFGKQSQRFDHYYFSSRKGNQTFSNTANILYSYQLSSSVGLSTGVEYSQQGQHISFSADSVFPSFRKQVFKVELTYIRLPFIVSYSVLNRKKSTVAVYSGISMGTAVRRKDNYQDIILEDILLAPAEKRYRKTDWAIPVGMTYKKDLTSKVILNIGCEYLMGLTNAFSEGGTSEFGVLSEFDNSRQDRLSINLGIGFHLTK